MPHGQKEPHVHLELYLNGHKPRLVLDSYKIGLMNSDVPVCRHVLVCLTLALNLRFVLVCMASLIIFQAKQREEEEKLERELAESPKRRGRVGASGGIAGDSPRRRLQLPLQSPAQGVADCRRNALSDSFSSEDEGKHGPEHDEKPETLVSNRSDAEHKEHKEHDAEDPSDRWSGTAAFLTQLHNQNARPNSGDRGAKAFEVQKTHMTGADLKRSPGLAASSNGNESTVR